MHMSKGFAKTYFRLTLPAIIAQLVVFVVDNLNVAILGTLSDKAISGFTIANQSFDIYSMLALGLSGGFHVYISQLYGKKDRQRYNQVLRLGLGVTFAVGLLYSLGMCLFAEPFIRMFIKDTEMIAYGVTYLKIYAWSHLFYGVNLMLSGTYSIIGQAVVAMQSGTINCIVSLLCSYVFVYGKFGIAPMGVSGAALAILCGRIAEFLYLFVRMMHKGSDFSLFEKLPKLEGDVMARVMRTAYPLIMNETCYALAFLIIVKNYSVLNERYLACYTVTNNCNKLFFAAAYGLSPAVGALIGRELGNHNYDKARENGNDILKMVFWIHIFFGALLIALSGVIPSFFSLEGDIARVCTQMLIIKSIFGLFGGYGNAFYNILRIGGASKFVFFFDGVFSLICPMVVSFVVCLLIPFPFVWAFGIVDAMNIVKSGIGFYLYKKEVWLNQLS